MVLVCSFGEEKEADEVVRLCGDYRRLNSTTKLDLYLLFWIDFVDKALAYAHYFGALNLILVG